MPEINDQEALDLLRYREERWGGLIRLIPELRKLVKGDWDEAWADDRGNPDTEWPMIANLFRDTVEDMAQLFAEAIPLDRRDYARDSEKNRAETVEQALVAYNEGSRFYSNMETIGQDIVGAGYAAVLSWPDFSLPVGKRFPRFRIQDPESVLLDPTWRNHQATDNVILHYTRPVAKLVRDFEDPVRELLQKVLQMKMSHAANLSLQEIIRQRFAPPELECLDFFSSDWIYRAIVYRDKDADIEIARTLVSFPNDTGVCPVQVAPRKAWAFEPMSQIADTRGIARTRNRQMKLMLDYFSKLVYGPTVVWRIQNPDFRKQIWRALSEDAYAKQLGTENMSPHALALFQMLEGEERTGKVNLPAREGDVDLNKATAAYLTRAQSKPASVVKSVARSFAAMKERLNEAALAQDEMWCDARKEITGRHRGRRFRSTYTPSEAIRGDHQNRVVYGTVTGVDRPTEHVLDLQKFDRGAMSLEDLLERDQATDDPQGAILRIRREKLINSIFDGLDQADLSQRVKFVNAFNQAIRENKSTEQFVEEVEKLLAPPAAPAASAMPGGPEAAALGTGPSGTPEAEQGVVEVPPSLGRIRENLLRR